MQDLPSNVIQIGSEVSTNDIDSYLKLRDAEDKRFKLKTVLDAWSLQQKEDREMRKRYATFFILILVAQIIFINIAFFFIGFGLINVKPTTLNIFIISVFGEIVSMTLVILKYLFPKTGAEIIRLFKNM